MKRLLIFALLPLFVLQGRAQEGGEWSLSDCVQYALAHNINIKQQENNVQQQQVLLSTSKNSRLPDLNGSISENFSFGRALTSDNTYMNRNTQNTGFSLSTGVPVFTAGRIPADIKMRRLNLQAALQDFEYARESVMLGVATSFLEAVCQKDMVQVAERQVELSRVQVRRMELLYENDKISEADLSQIRSTLANDELSLTQQRNRYMLALLDLSQLLELESPDGFDVARPLIDSAGMAELPSPDMIYNEALGIKPQIQAEQIRLQSAQKNVLLAKSAYYPTLYLNAGLGSSYYKTSGFESMGFGRQLRDNFNQYIGASLSVPIFNRFATRNGVRSARLQVNAQQMRLEQVKKSLYKEIQQAYYNAVAAIRQCESSDVALTSASTSFDLMQRKYENGKATLADYQDAKTKYMQAESQQIQSRYTWLFRRKILDFYRGITL
jgi:outer membrane protein